MSVATPAHVGNPKLPVLLGKAVQAPECVSTRDGGAVLALSIHCLFVRAGFRDVAYKKGSPYAPQHNWNAHQDAWVWKYRKPGLANTVTYTCALKQATSQAYIHVEEDNNTDNVAFMGLILTKYVQDLALLKQDTWEGVLSNEADLEAYFHEYLVSPLVARAVESSDNSNSNASTNNRTRLNQAGVGFLAASAMLLLVGRMRRKSGRRRHHDSQ